MKQALRAAIVHAFNEYDLRQPIGSPHSNVLHVGSETYKELAKIIMGKNKDDEEVKLPDGTALFSRLLICHTEIPRMMIADHYDPSAYQGASLDMSAYPSDFIRDPETFKRMAASLELAHRDLGEVAEKYNEPVYAVGSAYPGETRHETALRYIREAERGSTEAQIGPGANFNFTRESLKMTGRSVGKSTELSGALRRKLSDYRSGLSEEEKETFILKEGEAPDGQKK